MVTDEEESGETTSSCDEDDRADRCSSDTASAPSPVDKILNEGTLFFFICRAFYFAVDVKYKCVCSVKHLNNFFLLLI